ncbi:hypothetical protein Y1Q_0005145 [Alligator mississippiensis]|uniref:Uncharacterized protein n=1 Tax=Alligator mississippiensis TaxID=8496 RepID=A0A151LY97_ALLMI|nr:hypothetical protein Y1Q_0005145 [Alligator mississippiensis]
MLATVAIFYQDLYTEKPVDPEATQLCLQTDVDVVDCVKMVLSELQTYYQKSVVEEGDDAAKATWHRDMWHRIIQHPLSGERGGGNEEEGTSGTKDSSSGSSSGSWSDNDGEDT